MVTTLILRYETPCIKIDSYDALAYYPVAGERLNCIHCGLRNGAESWCICCRSESVHWFADVTAPLLATNPIIQFYL